MVENLWNWARNYQYRAARIHRPRSVEEIQELVASSDKVRALGTRHSFNDIADTAGDLVSTENLNQVLDLDRDRLRVTVEAGMPYGRLAEFLCREGFALHNLASLPHISIAGACATATHGSGDANGNLATAVTGLQFVRGDGELVTLVRGDEEFPGSVVNLGGLGIVTRLSLEVSPSFQLRQEVYENLPFAGLAERFEAVTSEAYSVSLFTRWQGSEIDQVWIKRRMTDDLPETLADTFHGATVAPENRHPIPGASAIHCTAQMGVPGPWHERLPHFRMDFTPSSGEELQSEYLVPRAHAWKALQAVDGLRDRVAPLLQISEIRTMAADDLWMSPSYGTPCVGIHFTWKKDWESVSTLLPTIQDALAPFEARPHWGKLFTTPPDRVKSLYNRLPDFRELLKTYDPTGKFRNAYLDRLL